MSQANAAFDGDYPATAADPPAITAAATASLDSNGGGGGGGVARQEGELLSIGWAGFSELIGAADILVCFVLCWRHLTLKTEKLCQDRLGTSTGKGV